MPGNWQRSLKKVDAVNSIARLADQGIDPAYDPTTLIQPPLDDDYSPQHSLQAQQNYGNGQNAAYFNSAPDTQPSFSSTSNAPAHQHLPAAPSQNLSHTYSGPPPHTMPPHTTQAMYNVGPVNPTPVYHHGTYTTPIPQGPPAAYDPYATPMLQNPQAAYNPYAYHNADYPQPLRSQTMDHPYSQPQAPTFHRSQTVPIYANANANDLCPNSWCRRQVHPANGQCESCSNARRQS